MTSDLESNDLPRFADLDAEYEILRELGRGGTAVVYLARERQLGRKVAIKVIRATYIEDEEAAARLEREARTIANLQHPNIVMLYGTRRLRDRSLALIMQYVPGRTLKTEVQVRGPLPFNRVYQILSDLGRALTCAQQQRIVHRDLKPENVYIDDGTGAARLSDFGIARPWDTDQGLTMPGAALGTPAYMSPEQIDGIVLDGRSDLYSLGLVGYQMLTGRMPWAGETLFNVMFKQKHEALPPLMEMRPGTPVALQRAIEGALHKDRAERWADAQEFLEALNGRITEPQRTEEQVDPAWELSPYRPSATRVVPFEESLPQSEEEAAESLARVENVLASEVEIRPRPRGRTPVLAAAVPALLLLTALVLLANRGSDDATPPAISPPEGVQTKAATPVDTTTPDPRPVLAWALLGDRQVGLAGDTLPQSLVLQVENAARGPVAGVTVNFAVTGGDGAIEPRTAVTDETGVVRARWLLRRTGTHTVSAAVPDLKGHTITFSARAVARPAARIAAVTATDLKGTFGNALAAPLVVRVTDDRDSPVAGAQVRFTVRSGEGRIAPATAVTGEDGTARAEWVLGPRGAQEAVAGLVALSSAKTTFKASTQPSALAIRRGLTVGGTHTCLLNGDGDADCWGGNDRGQLGDGSTMRRSGAVRVDAPEPMAVLSAGVSHTCGLAVSGSVFCWGANVAGQLGDGSHSDRAQPVKVAIEESIARVFTGMAHSCGLTASGRLFCWGQNSSGQLGDGTKTDRATPVSAAGGRSFRSVALGWAHTCALASDGAAFCWGRNASGELGDGSNTDRTEATAVSGSARFSAIAAGSGHTCGLTTTGTVMCWGLNSFGQLGNGSSENSATPVAVQPTDFFSAVALGSVHSCALTRDGSARCWGRNTYGQLGDGSSENRLEPTLVAGGYRFSALDASGAHTCGVAGGATYCWGYNSEGQLGNGTRINQSRPVAVNRQ